MTLKELADAMVNSMQLASCEVLEKHIGKRVISLRLKAKGGVIFSITVRLECK